MSIKLPSPKPETYELQPNKFFKSEAEIQKYAAERNATIKKIWRSEMLNCILLMPVKKDKK